MKKASYKNSNIEGLKKKLNTLRSQYRKEKKAQKDSKKSGAGVDDIKGTKTFVLQSFQFLR